MGSKRSCGSSGGNSTLSDDGCLGELGAVGRPVAATIFARPMFCSCGFVMRLGEESRDEGAGLFDDNDDAADEALEGMRRVSQT